jgi:uncharacterized protein YgiB involved in biofilm formation
MDKKKLVLVLVPLLLTGCSDSPDAMQRDVYTKFEDCMADWGKTELCQQLQEADAAQFTQQTTGTQSSGAHVIFWGPSYYSGERSVSYNGQHVAPKSNKAMSKPFAITSTSSASAKTSPGEPTTVNRGGFGGSSNGLSGG